jgi:hypothetical protein
MTRSIQLMECVCAGIFVNDRKRIKRLQTPAKPNGQRGKTVPRKRAAGAALKALIGDSGFISHRKKRN